MHAFVEHGGYGGWTGQPVDDAAKIRSHVAMPVRRRRHVSPRPQGAAVQRIAQVHGLEWQGHFQKLLQLRQAAFIVLAPAGNGEDDVIVVKTVGASVSMQSVGHDIAGTGSSFLLNSSGVFVTLPRPMFVLARSSLYPRRSRIGATTFSSPFSS